ncbi:hypothetical protein ABK040_009139 [Willaertia magna]
MTNEQHNNPFLRIKQKFWTSSNKSSSPQFSPVSPTADEETIHQHDNNTNNNNVRMSLDRKTPPKDENKKPSNLKIPLDQIGALNSVNVMRNISVTTPSSSVINVFDPFEAVTNSEPFPIENYFEHWESHKYRLNDYNETLSFLQNHPTEPLPKLSSSFSSSNNNSSNNNEITNLHIIHHQPLDSKNLENQLQKKDKIENENFIVENVENLFEIKNYFEGKHPPYLSYYFVDQQKEKRQEVLPLHLRKYFETFDNDWTIIKPKNNFKYLSNNNNNINNNNTVSTSNLKINSSDSYINFPNDLREHQDLLESDKRNSFSQLGMIEITKSMSNLMELGSSPTLSSTDSETSSTSSTEGIPQNFLSTKLNAVKDYLQRHYKNANENKKSSILFETFNSEFLEKDKTQLEDSDLLLQNYHINEDEVSFNNKILFEIDKFNSEIMEQNGQMPLENFYASISMYVLLTKNYNTQNLNPSSSFTEEETETVVGWKKYSETFYCELGNDPGKKRALFYKNSNLTERIFVLIRLYRTFKGNLNENLNEIYSKTTSISSSNSLKKGAVDKLLNSPMMNLHKDTYSHFGWFVMELDNILQDSLYLTNFGSARFNSLSISNEESFINHKNIYFIPSRENIPDEKLLEVYLFNSPNNEYEFPNKDSLKQLSRICTKPISGTFTFRAKELNLKGKEAIVRRYLPGSCHLVIPVRDEKSSNNQALSIIPSPRQQKPLIEMKEVPVAEMTAFSYFGKDISDSSVLRNYNFKNDLFIYPLSTNFNPNIATNLQVSVSFSDRDNDLDNYYKNFNIFYKTFSNTLENEVHSFCTLKCEKLEFSEELKCHLPILNINHENSHLIFRFYNIAHKEINSTSKTKIDLTETSKTLVAIAFLKIYGFTGNMGREVITGENEILVFPIQTVPKSGYLKVLSDSETYKPITTFKVKLFSNSIQLPNLQTSNTFLFKLFYLIDKYGYPINLVPVKDGTPKKSSYDSITMDEILDLQRALFSTTPPTHSSLFSSCWFDLYVDYFPMILNVCFEILNDVVVLEMAKEVWKIILFLVDKFNTINGGKLIVKRFQKYQFKFDPAKKESFKEWISSFIHCISISKLGEQPTSTRQRDILVDDVLLRNHQFVFGILLKVFILTHLRHGSQFTKDLHEIINLLFKSILRVIDRTISIPEKFVTLKSFITSFSNFLVHLFSMFEDKQFILKKVVAFTDTLNYITPSPNSNNSNGTENEDRIFDIQLTLLSEFFVHSHDYLPLCLPLTREMLNGLFGVKEITDNNVSSGSIPSNISTKSSSPKQRPKSNICKIPAKFPTFQITNFSDYEHGLYSVFIDTSLKSLYHADRPVRLKAINCLRTFIQRTNYDSKYASDKVKERLNMIHFEFFCKLLEIIPDWKNKCDSQQTAITKHVEQQRRKFVQEEITSNALRDSINANSKNPQVIKENANKQKQLTISENQLKYLRLMILQKEKQLLTEYENSQDEKRQLLICFLHTMSSVGENYLRNWWQSGYHLPSNSGEDEMLSGSTVLRSKLLITLQLCLQVFEYSGSGPLSKYYERKLTKKDQQHSARSSISSLSPSASFLKRNSLQENQFMEIMGVGEGVRKKISQSSSKKNSLSASKTKYRNPLNNLFGLKSEAEVGLSLKPSRNSVFIDKRKNSDPMTMTSESLASSPINTTVNSIDQVRSKIMYERLLTHEVGFTIFNYFMMFMDDNSYEFEAFETKSVNTTNTVKHNVDRPVTPVFDNIIRTLLNFLYSTQSEEVSICAMLYMRYFFQLYSNVLFNPHSEYAMPFAEELLRLCNSTLPNLRQHAAACFYLLIRFSFEENCGISVPQMTATLALSQVLQNISQPNHLQKISNAGNAYSDCEYIAEAIKCLPIYASKDDGAPGSKFFKIRTKYGMQEEGSEEKRGQGHNSPSLLTSNINNGTPNNGGQSFQKAMSFFKQIETKSEQTKSGKKVLEIMDGFHDAVNQLSKKLLFLVQDTIEIRKTMIKRKDSKESFYDPYKTEELFFRISENYSKIPELRLAWLEQLAQFHKRLNQYEEAAHCYLRILTLVFDYLESQANTHQKKTISNYFHNFSSTPLIRLLPLDQFFAISPLLLEFKTNINQTTSLSNLNNISSNNMHHLSFGNQHGPTEFTSERGVMHLIEECIDLLELAECYEYCILLHKMLIPIYETSSDFDKLSLIYEKLTTLYKKCAEQNGNQNIIYPYYYRVKFIGKAFGNELNGKAFIYKMPRLFKLFKMNEKIKEIYGKDVEIIAKSLDPSTPIDENKSFIQINHVKPFVPSGEQIKTLKKKYEDLAGKLTSPRISTAPKRLPSPYVNNNSNNNSFVHNNHSKTIATSNLQCENSNNNSPSLTSPRSARLRSFSTKGDLTPRSKGNTYHTHHNSTPPTSPSTSTISGFDHNNNNGEVSIPKLNLNRAIPSSLQEIEKLLFDKILSLPYFIPRDTEFQRNMNINQFSYEFSVDEQGNTKKKSSSPESSPDGFKKKVVITVDGYFPSLKTRLPVVEEVEFLLTPIESAIEMMELQIRKLENALLSFSLPTLQPVLQGSVKATVNGGPGQLPPQYLSEESRMKYPKDLIERLNEKCFKFLCVCDRAIKFEAVHMKPNDRQFHSEIEKGFIELKELWKKYLSNVTIQGTVVNVDNLDNAIRFIQSNRQEIHSELDEKPNQQKELRISMMSHVMKELLDKIGMDNGELTSPKSAITPSSTSSNSQLFEQQ